MSLLARMQANVGDPDPVWRYLLEKVAHTAYAAWFLGCLLLGLSLPELYRPRVALIACSTAVVSAIVYDVVGKIIWLHQRGHLIQDTEPPFAVHTPPPLDVSFEIRDTLFDLWVGLLPAACTAFILHWWLGPIAVALWCVGIAVGSNNQWGSPS